MHALHGESSDHVSWLALGAFGYAMIRFIEAYGLWRKFRRTEWFALLSGAIYLPFEVYELMHSLNLLSATALLVNLGVMFYLYLTLKSQRPEETTEPCQQS